MKAAVYRGIGHMEIEEIDTPHIGDSEALVKVEMVGICGTDVKTFVRGHPMFQPPCILGHEFVGKIIKVGENIKNDFGDATYVIAPYIGCGECELCREGTSQLCRNKYGTGGAFAEYVKVPAEILERAAFCVPDGIAKEVMVLAEPLACAIHGIEKARATPNKKVLVVGSGPMGLLIGITLKNLGSIPVIAEIDEIRLNIAQNCGLETIDFGKEGFENFMKEKPMYNSIILANDKVDLVSKLIPFVIPGGTFELFGGMPKDARLEIDPYYIHYEEVGIVGSFGFTEEEFKQAYDLLCDDPDTYGKLISKIYEMDDIHEAFKAAMDKSNIKIIVNIN